MVVRGAPAIAITGMYGIVLFLRSFSRKPTYTSLMESIQRLKNARPTAVNLSVAINDYIKKLEIIYESRNFEEILTFTQDFANDLYNQEIQNNLKISEFACSLLEGSSKQLSLLTHCNTGSLATAGIGTALGVIYTLKEKGYNLTVYVDETRPYHQGSRLTAWELQENHINYYIITDSMAGWVLKTKNIDAIFVGADRIASNGDTANKIGTYFLSIAANKHKVPFYVAAPTSTFDLNIQNGDLIEIEMRPKEEITQLSILKDKNGDCLIPEGVLSPPEAKVLNPSFDVTPAENINAIITEKGIIQPVSLTNIKRIISS